MANYIGQGLFDLGGLIGAASHNISTALRASAIQIYMSFQEAITGIFGGLNPVSALAHLAVIAVILIITYLAAKIADHTLARYFPKVMGRVEVGVIGSSDAAANRTINALIRRLATALIYMLGLVLVVLQVPQLQRVATAVLAGAGIAGLALGLAAKDPLSNVAAGISLAIFQPFRVGDYIDFKEEYGQIEDLTLRHTVIRTWDNRRIIVPNSIISTESIINWSIREPEIEWVVDFKIFYASDIDRAREIILEESSRHPMVLKDRPISVLLTEEEPPDLNLKLFISIPGRDVAYRVGCDIREAVEKRFEKDGLRMQERRRS